MFELKKIIGGLIMPLPLMLILLFLLLLFSSKDKKLLWSLKLFLIVGLWSISTPWLGAYITEPLEQRFRPFNVKSKLTIDRIVVLGCAVRANPNLPANSQMGGCAINRLVEGLRLLSHYPNALLVVSGAGVGTTTISELMAKTAISLGVDPKRIRTNPNAKDTAEEAFLLAPSLVDKRVALVTSASHMTRATLLFNKQGVDVIPAPTDFSNLNSRPTYTKWVADDEVLTLVTAHVHEWVGLAWIALIRWFDPEQL
ncbi:hypothetical protein PALB_25740 [Pseudoalteromonas luteoviolacea B = ATCC 29581]|nr:hypothetical protein PALB_25740 [Pseudoalteromonas luteoviolacea B = ATCC 29581]